jgi:hypothetical protein
MYNSVTIMRISYGGFSWDNLSKIDFWELEHIMDNCSRIIKDLAPNE